MGSDDVESSKTEPRDEDLENNQDAQKELDSDPSSETPIEAENSRSRSAASSSRPRLTVNHSSTIS